MTVAIQKLLGEVEKPARYVGGELHSVAKPSVLGRMALCFPDVYEIGMSHLGLRILYAAVNAKPDLAAERCFAPWPDMADRLRAERLPLFTLETSTPLRDCDVVGFSLQYELGHTNVLEMLDLAGIQIRATDRSDTDPVVVGGGPMAFNPEPVADFFDAFLVGDGEEAAAEILRAVAVARRARAPRASILRDIAEIPGAYVPSLVETRAGRFTTVVDKIIGKRVLRRLDLAPLPAATPVSSVPPVHDRVVVEVMRGCPHRCRFCQAGVIYRPTRYRDPNSVVETALRALQATGQDEVGLCSLSSGDYPYLERVSEILMQQMGAEKGSLSLSSLRASSINQNLAAQISRGRRTGFTIAPEAGSQRLRDVVAKNITEEMIFASCREAFKMGWNSLKFYFMIGLPTETAEDVEAIGEMARRVVKTFPGKSLTVSVSSFVPKPHTPFQWAAQETLETLRDKQAALRDAISRVKGVRFKYHHPEMSYVEAVISRGDRPVGALIEQAWQMGQRFAGWTDQFRFDVWRQASEQTGIQAGTYTSEIPLDEPLPWDHIETTLPKEEHRKEWEKALGGATTASCLDVACADCMACTTREGDMLRLKRVEVTRPEPPPQIAAPAEPLMFRGWYEKRGPAAFLSHLDMGHTLRMAFRRSGLRLAFTKGFNPLPKFTYGPPLPVGMEGMREVLDFGLGSAVSPEEIIDALNRQLPAGIRFLIVRRIPGVRSHLAREVVGAVYEADSIGRPIDASTDAGDPRMRVRSAVESDGRLFLLVHPEARMDRVYEALTGEKRGRSEFKRVAVVLGGDDWRSFLPVTDNETRMVID
ncbi:MAG: TIGR03960 family B12-binding radical SAM protein [Acidobacteriota bacterium]